MILAGFMFIVFIGVNAYLNRELSGKRVEGENLEIQ